MNIYSNIHIVLISPEDIVKDRKQNLEIGLEKIGLGKIFFSIAR